MNFGVRIDEVRKEGVPGYSSKGVLRIIEKKAALKSLLTEEPLLVNGKKP